MLTPYFELRQTETEVLIIIHAPYANIKDTEIHAEENDFRFYSTPYYLRLHLPGKVKDIDEPSARYIADKRQFEVTLLKSDPGEVFPDLDLVGQLLAPKKQKQVIKPDIQVISSTKNLEVELEKKDSDKLEEDDDDADADDDDDDDDDDDEYEDAEDPYEWSVDQVPMAPELLVCSANSPRYGFANQVQGAFKNLGEEFSEVINLSTVDEIAENKRADLRKIEEEMLFSDDHYLSDLMEPENVKPYLDFSPPWEKPDYKATLTPEDFETLKNLGNKEYLLTKSDKISAVLSLVDIMFACAYDFRTTLGEANVESAWTINKLSATLSWLQIFNFPKEVAESCFRRSFVYPLFRHWGLSNKVLRDTVNILKAGKRQILWFLLRTRRLFNESEPRYLLNELYIKDYCIWLQGVSDSKLFSLAKSLEEISLSKGEVGLDLDILEVAASSVMEDEQEGQLTQRLSGITLKDRAQKESDTADDDVEDSDDDDSDDDDDDDSSSSLDSDDISEPDG